ncbi:MAG: GGDEF domain-containing protein [Myxococcota bacterium]
MIRLRRGAAARKGDGKGADTGDLQRALGSALELLERLARRNPAAGLDEASLRKLRLRAERASDARDYEALAEATANLRLRPGALVSEPPPRARTAPRTRGPAPAATLAFAAERALPVARATGIQDTSAPLERLSQGAVEPPPTLAKDYTAAMDTIAHAVIFLRQRGDVMHTSMGELAHLVASLADDEPQAALRLEQTRSRLADAESIGELERLRETLLQEAGTLVAEARCRAERAAEASEMVRLQEAHRRVLELALDSATAMAEVDALTGLGNRRALERAVTGLARHGQDVGVVVLDLDFFKKINDTYGHAGGDRVLRAAAATLRAELRGNDRAFRSGGEEFVMLLPSTGEDGSARTAERIRAAFEDQLVQAEGGAIRFSASFGVAVWGGRSDYRSALARADRALYAAKRNGRNQVAVAK